MWVPDLRNTGRPTIIPVRGQPIPSSAEGPAVSSCCSLPREAGGELGTRPLPNRDIDGNQHDSKGRGPQREMDSFDCTKVRSIAKGREASKHVELYLKNKV